MSALTSAERLDLPHGDHSTDEHGTVGRIQRNRRWHVLPGTQARAGGRVSVIFLWAHLYMYVVRFFLFLVYNLVPRAREDDQKRLALLDRTSSEATAAAAWYIYPKVSRINLPLRCAVRF